jgi:hypothetical protein
MGFNRYRVTKDLSLGQLRRTLRAGDILEFDGTTTRVDGRDHRISTMDAIIGNKWLVLDEESTAISVPEHAPPARVAPPELPVVPLPELPPLPRVDPPRAPKVQELDIRGERIPWASDAARAANGVRPKANQKHVWGDGTAGAPAWLNGGEKGERTCVVCGVTERTLDMRVDRKRADGSQQIHYTDAHGNKIVALEELGCPTYVGDPSSAAAYAKDQVRKVRGQVDDVVAYLGTVDARLAQLEADNDFLRQRLIDRPVLTAEVVAEALLLLAERSGQAPQLSERVRALLPDALDLGDDVLRPLIEAEPVMAEVYHPEGTPDPAGRER